MMIRHDDRRRQRPSRRRRSTTATPRYPLCILAIAAAAAASTAEAAPPSTIEADARYVAVQSSPPPSGATSGGERLLRAMSELDEALSATRRLVDGEDGGEATTTTTMKGGADATNDGTGRGGDGAIGGGIAQAEEDAEDASGGDDDKPQKPPPPQQTGRHPSSDWWERLYQGGYLLDESQELYVEEQTARGGDDGRTYPSSTRPANRRSHSATVHASPSSYDGGDGEGTEWMIVSGGFTDEDWETFPVWAYDMSHGATVSEVEDALAGNDAAMMKQMDGAYDGDHHSGTRPWVDLTRLDDDAPRDAPWEGVITQSDPPPSSSSDSNIPPRGRVGHLSSVHDGCLHVFGGLTYKLGSFSVDRDDDDDGNAPIVWKACGLDAVLDGRGMNAHAELTWERIVPRVNAHPPVRPGVTCTKSVDGTTCVKGGGNKQGTAAPHDGSDDRDDDDGSNDARRAQGIPLRAPPLAASGTTSTRQHDNSSDTTIADIPEQRPVHSKSQRNEAVGPPDPSSTLPRGEAQGGHYRPITTNVDDRRRDHDCFVFYGGMHHHRSPTETGLQATTILGDVWKYDYGTETLSLLAPYPPLPWQRDERNGSYPRARTAHAGTIVSSQLIVHGGMHFSDDEYSQSSSAADSKRSSSFSSPSGSYATYKTSSRWQPLSDVWEFDLEGLRWRERVQFPQLARSYHSLVGWGNGTVASFGGFQQDNNIPGETVAFVFKDLILSRPNETNWQKLLPPHSAEESSPMAHWRTAASSESYSRPGITNRLEHSAVLDRYGSMYVWGGRFQTVGQIVGLWRLDVFNEDSDLKYEIAPPDGIEQYEAELQAFHMFIATMMFMSLTISSLFSMMRRQAEGENGGGGGGRSLSRGRGLSRQVIDSLPIKRYEAPRAADATEDGDVVEDVSLGREDSLDEDGGAAALQLENADCCPICLVEYEVGVSQIRTLPCGHSFDVECIDSWFAAHTTCPSCRANVDDSPASEVEETSAAVEEQYEFDPRWQFVTGFDDVRRRHSHWAGANNRSSIMTGLGSIRHSHWNGAGGRMVEASESDESGEEDAASPRDDGDDEEISNVEIRRPIGPMFWGFRNLFGERGQHRALAVSGEDEGEDEPAESIELV